MTIRARPTSAGRRGGVEADTFGVVAILMTDVEPAVRLNAALEAQGVDYARYREEVRQEMTLNLLRQRE